MSVVCPGLRDSESLEKQQIDVIGYWRDMHRIQNSEELNCRNVREGEGMNYE